ncbi:MAG TPA: YdgA family protein [Castellaniella sp.]|nr:YdgA family protein [Castellaniella sp.]
MNRRLKIAAAGAAVVVLAYGAASWYAGRVAQQSIEAWILRANDEIKANWASDDAPPVLRVDDYRRGVFSSHVRYVFEFHDDQDAAQAVSLQDDLQHGPWPLAAVRDGFWAPLAAYSRMRPLPGGPWQPWFEAMPEGQAPWRADSRIGFDGSVASLMTLAPARTADQRVDFSGATVQLSYHPRNSETVVSAQAQSLELRDPETAGRLGMRDIRYDSRTTRSGETDLQSHQQLRLSRLTVHDQSAPEVQLDEPSAQLDMARTGGLLDSRVQYDLGRLSAGPQDLGTVQFKASAEQVDIEALHAFLVAVDDAQADDETGAMAPEDERRVRAALVPLLASSPKLTLDRLTWTTPKGKTDLRAQAQFRPVMEDAPGDAGALAERGIREVSVHAGLSKAMLLDVLRQSQADSENPDMAVALFSMLFDQYAGRLVRAGLLREQDGQVQIDVSYADGRVTANGVEMAPDAFIHQLNATLGLGE